MPTSRRLLALVAGLAAVAACAPPPPQDGRGTEGTAAEGTAVQVAATTTGPGGLLRPRSLSHGEPLRVRANVTMAPLAMRAQDGSGREGAEIDIVTEIANRWGAELDVEASGGHGLVDNLGAGTADIALGGLTSAQAASARVTLVPTMRGDVAWAVATGNPHKLSPIALCGQAVAVQGGTLIREHVVRPYEDTCQEQGNPMRVQTYGGQDQATAALVAGKVDALVGPGPAVRFAVAAAPEQMESMGQEAPSGTIGLVARTDDETFAPALRAAVEQLRQDGTMSAILARWDLADRDLDAVPTASTGVVTGSAAPRQTTATTTSATPTAQE